MNKRYIIVFFTITSLTSCNLLYWNTTSNTERLNEISFAENEIIEKTNSRNVSPDKTVLVSKIKINKEDQETTINAQIRIKKDSVIWISVKAPLGIEVFRIMITPDSIYYMNRINKEHFTKHISHIEELLKTNISFKKIQEILLASPKIESLNSEKEKYEINKDIFRVIKMELIETEHKRVSINYYDHKVFSKLGGMYFPKKVFIEIKSQEVFKESFYIEINYTKIDFNKDFSLSFTIPKSYDPID